MGVMFLSDFYKYLPKQINMVDILEVQPLRVGKGLPTYLAGSVQENTRLIRLTDYRTHTKMIHTNQTPIHTNQR